MRRFLKNSLLVCLLIPLAAILAGQFLVVNTTRSFPLGIYQKTHAPVRAGDLVLACPEDNAVSRFGREHGFLSYGICPERYGYLIKRIAGLPGDRVDFTERGVFVSGRELPNSARQPGIPVQAQGSFVLRHQQAILMSEHPKSFDSRYFGPIRLENICTPLKPFIIWE